MNQWQFVVFEVGCSLELCLVSFELWCHDVNYVVKYDVNYGVMMLTMLLTRVVKYDVNYGVIILTMLVT